MNTTEIMTPRTARRYGTLLLLAAFSPILYHHFHRVLGKPHYQFLWFLPVGLFILWSEVKPALTEERSDKYSLIAGTTLLILSILGLTAGTLYWSPWIGSVSFLLGLAGIIACTFSRTDQGRLAPLWVACCLIVPLPFGLDDAVTLKLRTFTTNYSSMILDHLGVLHNSYANVIRLPDTALFIADACSGVHSLFVLLGSALFLCCWMRRRVSHAVSLLLLTFGLVLIENVTRIVVVALAWRRGFDLTRGTNHEVLGIVLFILSLILVVTTDQLLQYIFPPNMPPLLQRLKGLRKQKTAYYEQTRRSSRTQLSRSNVWPVRLVFSAVTIMLLTVPLQFALSSSSSAIKPLSLSDFDAPEIPESLLPEEFEGMKRERFQTTERVQGDPFGQASQQWTYKDSEKELLVSLDYPYSSPHDLSLCYTNVGWEVVEERLDEKSASGPLATAVMYRDLYGHAVLVYQQMTLDGEGYAKTTNQLDQTVSGRIRDRLTPSEQGQPAGQSAQRKKQPLIQVQILVRLPTKPNENTINLARRLFQQVRPKLLQQLASDAK